jgi:hypothetical protein
VLAAVSAESDIISLLNNSELRSSLYPLLRKEESSDIACWYICFLLRLFMAADEYTRAAVLFRHPSCLLPATANLFSAVWARENTRVRAVRYAPRYRVPVQLPQVCHAGGICFFVGACRVFCVLRTRLLLGGWALPHTCGCAHGVVGNMAANKDEMRRRRGARACGSFSYGRKALRCGGGENAALRWEWRIVRGREPFSRRDGLSCRRCFR